MVTILVRGSDKRFPPSCERRSSNAACMLMIRMTMMMFMMNGADDDHVGINDDDGDENHVTDTHILVIVYTKFKY